MDEKKWFTSFWHEHGERLVFVIIATVFATVMYVAIPATREQIVAIYFLLLGLLINKARSPKDKGKSNETKDGQ